DGVVAGGGTHSAGALVEAAPGGDRPGVGDGAGAGVVEGSAARHIQGAASHRVDGAPVGDGVAGGQYDEGGMFPRDTDIDGPGVINAAVNDPVVGCRVAPRRVAGVGDGAAVGQGVARRQGDLG